MLSSGISPPIPAPAKFHQLGPCLHPSQRAPLPILSAAWVSALCRGCSAQASTVSGHRSHGLSPFSSCQTWLLRSHIVGPPPGTPNRPPGTPAVLLLPGTPNGPAAVSPAGPSRVRLAQSSVLDLCHTLVSFLRSPRHHPGSNGPEALPLALAHLRSFRQQLHCRGRRRLTVPQAPRSQPAQH